MNREEAIHKLEYSKKAYQTLIDEKVDSGKLVGDGVRGEWKAETPLDEAYKSMIEALDMAIKALDQEPCEKYIKEIDHLRKYISKLETQIIEQDNADTCYGCAFEDVEAWEMPCSKCKRNCKDYWRPKKEN